MSDLRGKNGWTIAGAVVLVVFLLWLCSGHLGLPKLPLSTKAIIAFTVAIAVLAATSFAVFSGPRREVQYVIAFDITVFLVVGMALLISTAVRWEAACLTAGAALLGGGFFGFIFGMPLSAVSAPDPGQAEVTTAKAVEQAKQAMTVAFADNSPEAKAAAKAAQEKATQAAARTGRIAKHSLLAEAASTLSKLIAGATLVQITPIYREFKTASAYISTYLLADTPTNGATLGGAVLLYFSFLGFLAGLFLPAYFMEGLFSEQ